MDSRVSAGDQRTDAGALVCVLGHRSVATELHRVQSDGAKAAIVRQKLEIASAADVALVRALSRIKPRHFPRILSVDVDATSATIVQEAVEGEPLSDLLATMPRTLALGVVADVLAGLGVLHALPDERGKPLRERHGDICAANVIVCRDGVARLVQLAGGRLAAECPSPTGIRYIAPELLIGDDNVDTRADLYSVGVLLWEILAGHSITEETRAGAIVQQHLAGAIGKPPTPADPPWLEQLADVAAKAISTDPQKRYATAAEMSDAIKAAAGAGIGSHSAIAAWLKLQHGEKIAARAKRWGVPLKSLDAILRTPPPMKAITTATAVQLAASAAAKTETPAPAQVTPPPIKTATPAPPVVVDTPTRTPRPNNAAPTPPPLAHTAFAVALPPTPAAAPAPAAASPPLPSPSQGTAIAHSESSSTPTGLPAPTVINTPPLDSSEASAALADAERGKRRKRAVIIVASLSSVALLVAVIGVLGGKSPGRQSGRDQASKETPAATIAKKEATASEAKPTKGEAAPAVSASAAESPAKRDDEPKAAPSVAATSEPTPTTKKEPVESTPRKSSSPEPVAKPTTKPATPSTPVKKSTPKPASTYDPLGI